MAPRIEVEVINGAEWNQAINGLTRFARDVPLVMDADLAAFAKEQAAMFRNKPYAPMRPAQAYMRTGRYGRSWLSRKISRGVQMVQNNASYKGTVYPSFVVGDGDGEGQAAIHRGRWYTARPIFEKEVGRFARKIGARFVEAGK
jgi:hypothetical protein